jgi:signal transduction histidine kinase
VNKQRLCLLRYAMAIMTVALALGLAGLLHALTPHTSVLFLAAVTLSAWYGGTGPAVLATVLSTLALEFLVFRLLHSRFIGVAETTRLITFSAVALLIGSLNVVRQRAEQAQAHALAREREALARAEEASRNKDQFLAFLGHELRSPLGTIQNVAQLLGREKPEAANVAWAQRVLERQVQQMSRLLEDLLDISRIGRGKIDLRRERLDLTALLQATAEDQQRRLEEAGLRFQVELPTEPLWVIGDRTRLEQVISNLLDNATKFTDTGGTITLRLTTTGGGQWAAITVHDTGLGIEPTELPRVFELFAQAQRTRDQSRGGLGLGLALVKGLVELHGGNVRAASDGLGQGAHLTVWLPLPSRADGLKTDSSPSPTGTFRS